MAAITERRRFRLLALAKPNLFLFFKRYFYTPVGHAFHLLMRTVAKWFFERESATAPGIYFAGLYHYTGRLFGCYPWQSFIGYSFHCFLFVCYKFIKIEITFLVCAFDFFFQFDFRYICHPFLFDQVKGLFSQQPERFIGEMGFL
jgi:hypothetical protein